MAVIATFKQQCPSCEAMISIKENMLGRKVECTKCKDKFIAEKPEEEEDLDEVEVDEEDEAPARSKSKRNGKAAPSKRPKLEVEEDDDDERPAKGKARHDEDDDDDDEADSKTKKKSGGSSNKLVIGLGLAGVGVLILVVAAYFIMRPPGGGGVRGPGFKGKGGENVQNPEDDKPKQKDTNVTPPAPVAVGLTLTEQARLSNLLPGDTEHVFHVCMKDLFAPGSTLRSAVWETGGGLNDNDLRNRLGFSVLALDDLICAEKYGLAGWRYAILHSKDVLDETDLKKALKLESGGPAIEGQTYYKVTKPNPALDQLARFSIGIPNMYRYFDRGERPTYVYLQSPQTLIIGDSIPVTALLKAKGQFPLQSQRTPISVPDPAKNTEPKTPPAPGNDPPPENTENKALPALDDKPPPRKGRPIPGKSGSLPGRSGQGDFVLFTQEVQPPGKDGTQDPKDPPKDPAVKDPAPAPTPQGEMYLTIKPSLKAVLDRMETKGNEKDVVLFSSATDMDANRVEGRDGANDGIVRSPRQFWDVSLMLYEAKPRLRFLGTALVQRDHLKYQLRNEMTCAQEVDARDFKQQLMDRTSVQIAKFIHQLVKHEVKLPSAAEKKDDTPPPPPGTEPEKKEKKEPLFSQMIVNQESNVTEFILDLLLDNPTLTHASNIATLTAAILRVEIESATGASPRHILAGAGKAAGEKGAPERQVERGSFPPGAFPRTSARLFTDKEPRNRISWMAALLPHLDQQTLYGKLRFDQSWRDSSNWLAGQTAVPQFLDPSYPDYTRQVSVNGLPVDFGATHYVGIAGVGLDAATYKRGDPATAHKRGVFSYDGAATMAEVLAGRGSSNTILMIQVPHDRGTGPTPWIAGGGATLRGVPEKNSIEPFVLGKNRENKTIMYQGKKGTFVLMTDGTVRFIDENIKDDVFKAMCTIEGPAPQDFDLKKNPNTVPVPSPDAKEIATTKKADPKSSKEPAAKKEQAPPTKKESSKGTPDDKSTLQGVWTVKSGEAKGQPLPAEATKILRFTFKGDTLIVRGNFGDEREEQGTFAIDVSKTPKHIDFKMPSTKKTALGIYELKMDELRVCLRHDTSSAGRPTSFAAQPDPELLVLVLQRQK